MHNNNGMPSSGQHPLHIALGYADLGHMVFPCKPDGPDIKKPCTPNGFKDATSEKNIIQAWWTRWPDALIGLPCQMNNLLVLDFDIYKPDCANIIPRFEADHRTSLKAHQFVVDTPRGGKHYYFLVPSGTSIDTGHLKSSIVGLDVKWNGYVIAPDHVNYVVARGRLEDIPPLPRSLTVPASRADTNAAEIAQTNGCSSYGLAAVMNESNKVSAASIGERNNVLFAASAALGGLISGGEVDEHSARDELFLACRKNGLVSDDGSDSVSRTIDSGFKTGKLTPRSAPSLPPRSVDSTPLIPVPSKVSDNGLKWACTDLGNAERFRYQHEHHVVYVPGLGWLVWDGTRWTRNNSLFMSHVLDTIRSLGQELSECPVNNGRVELSKWVQRTESSAGKNAMLDFSKTMLTRELKEFDRDQSMLNCLNGFIDLRTGRLIPHSPTQLVMKQALVRYEPNAQCPRFDRFIRSVLLDDKDYIDYMQKVLGYAITGEVNEQVFFIAYGRGSNGKTTLFETIMGLMGDYACTTEFDLFLSTDKTAVRTQEAVGKLKGKRIAVASETSDSRKFSEAVIKKVTGYETLTGANLHKDTYEFLPTHTLFFAANHLPGFKDGSRGMKRRIVVLPFDATFEGKTLDKDLIIDLRAESEGILSWLVAGAQRYYKEGLGDQPRVVRQATNEYIDDNDVLGRFIKECIVKTPNANISGTELAETYEAWCRENGEEIMDAKFSPKSMLERECRSKRTKSGRRYLGITLSENGLRLRDGEPTNSNPSHFFLNGDDRRNL